MTNPPYGERLSSLHPGRDDRPARDACSDRDAPPAPSARGTDRRRRAGPGRSIRPEQRSQAGAHLDPVAEKKLIGFYRGLAEMLARHAGRTAVLLSGNPLLERAIPLHPQVDHRLWNGPLEVHLLKYRIH